MPTVGSCLETVGAALLPRLDPGRRREILNVRITPLGGEGSFRSEVVLNRPRPRNSIIELRVPVGSASSKQAAGIVAWTAAAQRRVKLKGPISEICDELGKMSTVSTQQEA